MQLNSTEEIIEDIRQGKMVIIMDDEDRENEGDLVMAAEKVRAEDINFMATHGRGLICLTLTRERCQQLRLPMMVNDNTAMHSTAFTVSVEAAEGVTTGISAADRAVTVQAAVAQDARPEDLVQPGHIFPLMAQPGGVLTRAGHTEAGCDFTRLAGFEPAAVIVEILNPDGTMARRPDLEKFAQQHDLKIGTIADLIHYRVATEKTIERVAERKIDTEAGDFNLIAYHDTIDDGVHFALVKGEIDSEQPVKVRVHMQNTLCDVIGSLGHGCSWPLQVAMQHINKDGCGVVVILRQWETNQELLRKIQSSDGKAQYRKTPEGATELRTYGLGAQILSDLGVRKMRVLSAPMIMHGLSGFGLEVVDYISVDE